jgi:hypothetical protein
MAGQSSELIAAHNTSRHTSMVQATKLRVVINSSTGRVRDISGFARSALRWSIYRFSLRLSRNRFSAKDIEHIGIRE